AERDQDLILARADRDLLDGLLRNDVAMLRGLADRRYPVRSQRTADAAGREDRGEDAKPPQTTPNAHPLAGIRRPRLLLPRHGVENPGYAPILAFPYREAGRVATWSRQPLS